MSDTSDIKSELQRLAQSAIEACYKGCQSEVWLRARQADRIAPTEAVRDTFLDAFAEEALMAQRDEDHGRVTKLFQSLTDHALVCMSTRQIRNELAWRGLDPHHLPAVQFPSQSQSATI